MSVPAAVGAFAASDVQDLDGLACSLVAHLSFWLNPFPFQPQALRECSALLVGPVRAVRHLAVKGQRFLPQAELGCLVLRFCASGWT